MKTKLASLLAAVSMFMIVAVSWMPTASAWEEEGTQTTDEDQYHYQIIEFFNGDYLTLSYTIEVQNDVYIDVMLLNEVNFNLYKNHDTFTYYAEGTDFNTIYKKVSSITFYTHDNYYLVMDNTDYPPGGAMPPWNNNNDYCTFYYTISANSYYDDSGGGYQPYRNGDDEEVLNLMGVLCVLGILSLMIIVIIATAVYLKNKGQQPQPYYPPQQQSELSLQSPPLSPDYQQPPPPPDYRPPQQPY